MLQTAANAFIAFLVIFDPPGTAAIFAGMTRSMGGEQRRATAVRAVGLAALALLGFAMGGEALLKAMGIGLPALRLSGGLLLFKLAADMVFGRLSGMRAPPGRDGEQARDDITVFPLAFPLIAGPGALTTVVLMIAQAGGDELGILMVLAVLAINLGLLLFALKGADRVLRVLGVTGADAIGRVLGIILAALAAQFVIDGLRQAISG